MKCGIQQSIILAADLLHMVYVVEMDESEIGRSLALRVVGDGFGHVSVIRGPVMAASFRSVSLPLKDIPISPGEKDDSLIYKVDI